MIIKNSILGFIQGSFSDQEKIGNIFFIFSRPIQLSMGRRRVLQVRPPDAVLPRHRRLETIVAGSENAPVHAVAGNLLPVAGRPKAKPISLHTFLHGQGQDFRLIPLHCLVFPLCIIRLPDVLSRSILNVPDFSSIGKNT